MRKQLLPDFPCANAGANMTTMSEETADIMLTVNGERVTKTVPVRRHLVDFQRLDMELTGSHLACEHGVCGACTVLLDDVPVRSCLIFAVQAEDKKIRTVEGLADEGHFSLVQQAFHDYHALQCGFCTPGMLMLATWLVERDAAVDDEELREVIASNLCRCTGYQNILRAVRAVLDGKNP